MNECFRQDADNRFIRRLDNVPDMRAAGSKVALIEGASTEVGALKYSWLEKEYSRYCWWPYIEPVINHPDIPSLRASSNPAHGDKQPFYKEKK